MSAGYSLAPLPAAAAAAAAAGAVAADPAPQPRPGSRGRSPIADGGGPGRRRSAGGAREPQRAPQRPGHPPDLALRILDVPAHGGGGVPSSGALGRSPDRGATGVSLPGRWWRGIGRRSLCGDAGVRDRGLAGLLGPGAHKCSVDRLVARLWGALAPRLPAFPRPGQCVASTGPPPRPLQARRTTSGGQFVRFLLRRRLRRPPLL